MQDYSGQLAVQKWQRRKSGSASSTIVTVTPLAPSLTTYDLGVRVRKNQIAEKEAYLFYEDGGIGVYRQDGGKADISPPYLEDNADGARRCFVTGLRLPSVCIMDTEHEASPRAH